MKTDTHSSPSALTGGLATFCLAAGSSILFCSKGVIAKLAYAHGADALSVLALRMGFALPFFIGMIVVSSRGAAVITPADWARLAGLGFIGYYVSSLVNFSGLQYVSVGLERVVLYTYPSLVLAISAFVLRKPVRPAMWAACVVAWLGIVAAFSGEWHSHPTGEHVVLGTTLIFISALTYAIFILLSGDVIKRVGASRFTGLAVGFSCVFVLLHYVATHPAKALLGFAPSVYVDGLLLAVLGTVAPALLMSLALKRAGAQRFAIIGAIGPVATLFLAWGILKEAPNAGQVAGFALTLGGGLFISLMKDKPPRPAEAGVPAMKRESI